MGQESRDLKRYIAWLRDIRKYSGHTVKAYAGDIQQFLAFLAANGLEADKAGIRDFIARVSLGGGGKATVARKIYAVRSFYGFLVKSGALPHNPFDGIRTPKQEQRLPRVLSEDEMQAFLDALPEDTFLRLRNKALFELLYATGLRVSELTGLRSGDIRLNERLVRVMGKGRKERIVPFHDLAAELLARYRRRLQAEFPACGDLVFVNSRGGPLTARSVERILRQAYSQLARSQPRVHPHLLRHSFATHLLRRGANLRAIQELLGHASLATTEKYTSLDLADLMNTYRKFHPWEHA
ncbi:MAG: tyrosine-type recombinase/integrase [Acidobacteria bacterium]|jgi:integrase/recombinase XerC|nr:tyrosine-type recombinase/integrase [Acidobacteriota bacterium]